MTTLTTTGNANKNKFCPGAAKYHRAGYMFTGSLPWGCVPSSHFPPDTKFLHNNAYTLLSLLGIWIQFPWFHSLSAEIEI